MAAALESKVPRRLTGVVPGLLEDERVIVLQGPRAVGKSTLLRDLADAHKREVIDLDDLRTRDAVSVDPPLFVSGQAPVFIDEYQHVPELLDAIKAELNRSSTPGRFVLTGTTSYESLPRAAQSLAGRLHVVPVWPLSAGEVAGHQETFASTALNDPPALVTRTMSTTARVDYIRRFVTGGFPDALARSSEAARSRWFDDYVTVVMDRDVVDLSRIRQRALLPRLLARLASQTGQLLNIAKAADDLSMDRSTAENYTKLLEAVFLIHRLPAWGTTLRSRVVATPKVHLVDSGVAAMLLRLTEAKLGTLQPAALTELGHLVETFCVGELRKQLSWLAEPVQLGHWRTHDGHEVDLVVERMDGGIVGFEFKSDTRVPGSAFRGLEQLRDRLGPAFLGGFTLYTGERSYTYDDRLYVTPVDRLWTA
ncbi:MAG: ATP-binding protein [Jiangellaceae bacterium]